jgi:hypothetical protein
MPDKLNGIALITFDWLFDDLTSSGKFQAYSELEQVQHFISIGGYSQGSTDRAAQCIPRWLVGWDGGYPIDGELPGWNMESG